MTDCFSRYLCGLRLHAFPLTDTNGPVATLMTLDTVYVALLIHVIFYYTVTNFGDFLALLSSTSTLMIQVFIGHLSTCMVQQFFAYRVYRSSSVVFTVKGLQFKYFSKTGENLPWSVSALSIDFACDVVITIAMVYYLNRSRTQFAKTNRAINMLITYSLNTG
ncbi:hypothetical protein PUNSTDRAFT_134417 [Punctularia strigosozonata HHB-11173 SS5]|uniref:uncharacterized protein n=1 Tax=Punctularia strigosozonata (strain HHB-11173) TaxID=741275 RepID=UPI0004416CF7|nr:uncharacterized protein PUNSTDRAFT_134417 [Punctularia strigosozonata HHB-11173 SS5]EIN09255.1 hypothetical protein PUNSTDRAFT_134417 [Punctularia strigosozonata HHB-11173 SS5]